ncbi:ERF family protein [Sinorhizobium meliloti]|uniref:ERF family protein n=1 Tax=Rhizobium meliloti TaxID=382 RepID=UPI0002EF3737|nr:ERF family protein [Sinorhizobium meliloti]ASP90763.1 ERF family protein [Sinorhizobium meliloti]MDE3791725.1 ERF family protein [Sinorhizobium meliloti]MDW9814964.1 ERF family protein [Sinorhizobium meliloti]MQX60134.1 ERF family protein [Sinorhizobium meliloti]
MNQVATVEHEAAPVSRYDGPANQSTGLLGVIERIAGNPEVDVERMSALLKMRAEEEERIRRIEREDREDAARREWLAAFSAVQAKIGPIFRTNDNDHTKSKYADLADIERIVTPILTEHGFSTTSCPVPCELPGHIRMRLTIGHYGGHEKVYEDDFPLDSTGSGGKVNKTAIQAKGSTQTYARRYLKASALDLAFMDDRDGNRPKPEPEVETISEEQVMQLRELIEASEADEKRFLAFGKIERLADMPIAQFDSAMNMLKRRLQERTGR